MRFVAICPDGCENQKMLAPYRMKYDKELKKMIPEFIGTPPKCPVCGQTMVFAEEDSKIPVFSVGVFKGQPDDKKKEILRQRFDKDLKRGAADEKEQRKRNAIEKMIGYGK